METTVQIRRNQAMECFKLAAAVLVVIIHTQLPGRLGSALTSLTRIAVPGFFAISGYFSFQVNSKRLWKRAGRMLLLYAAAVVLAILLGAAAAVGRGEWLPDYLLRFVPSGQGILRAILIQDSCFPDTGYGWYLLSGALCYGILGLYEKLAPKSDCPYRPLYRISALLLAVHWILSEVEAVPFQLHRNGWLFGLPMMVLGIFIREYQGKISLTDAKLAAAAALGVVLVLVEWKLLGARELPVGAVLQVAALLLLMARHPDLDFPSAYHLGRLSTLMYLLHYPLISIYEIFLLPRLPLGDALEPWLRPGIIALLSMAVGIVWILLADKIKSRR